MDIDNRSYTLAMLAAALRRAILDGEARCDHAARFFGEHESSAVIVHGSTRIAISTNDHELIDSFADAERDRQRDEEEAFYGRNATPANGGEHE